MYAYVRRIWLRDVARCAIGLITEGLGGLNVSRGEEGMVFVGHSIKTECCFCTSFFLFFFFLKS